jgi:hypothetical protein
LYHDQSIGDGEGYVQQERRKASLIEKVLAGSCLVITGIYAMAEFAFSLSILSVTLLAFVALFKETLS